MFFFSVFLMMHKEGPRFPAPRAVVLEILIFSLRVLAAVCTNESSGISAMSHDLFVFSHIIYHIIINTMREEEGGQRQKNRNRDSYHMIATSGLTLDRFSRY